MKEIIKVQLFSKEKEELKKRNNYLTQYSKRLINTSYLKRDKNVISDISKPFYKIKTCSPLS